MLDELPIAQYRGQILDAVRSYPVVIITAETGAGKSTQVPQFLAEAGYRVVVTQPRRLAARTLAERVAKEAQCQLGERVGFRTAEEHVDSARTEILYITDGLQLVRELARSHASTKAETILVLDEVHEWNLNMEVLVAWIRAQESRVKTVLMSATLDADRLSAYFDSCPIIDVPGRLFSVERREAPADDLISTIVALAGQGRNILTFLPGKREIADTIEKLNAHVNTRTVLLLPLHGELAPDEQARCFEVPPPGFSKIVVATNVAQTSITIPDIDAVVDSGEERRTEVVDGIDGLYLRPISRADCEQRAGRAGRTREGIYVLCSDLPLDERQPFPVAEILRTRLDQIVLRLAIHGFDASTLAFFHQPSKKAIEAAHTALIELGALDPQGKVTQIGRRMARLPVRVELARMLVEAEQRKVVEPVATIAACLEVGDIRGRDAKWRLLTTEQKSDLLAVLDVFRAGVRNRKKLEDIGLSRRNFFRASEIRHRILDLLADERGQLPRRLSAEDRQEVLVSCLTGMLSRLYTRDGDDKYSNMKDGSRELARESVLSPSPEMLIGVPFDLPVKGRYGTIVLRLISMATAVDHELLRKIAPQQLSIKTGLDPVWEDDQVWSTTRICLNGREISKSTIPDPTHPRAAELFQHWLAEELLTESTSKRYSDAIYAYCQARKQRLKWNKLAGTDVFPIPSTYPQMRNWLMERIQGARNLDEIPEHGLDLPPIDPAQVAQIVADYAARKRFSNHATSKEQKAPKAPSSEGRSLRAVDRPDLIDPTVDDLKAYWNRRVR